MFGISTFNFQRRCLTLLAVALPLASVTHAVAADVVVVSNLTEPFRANSPIGNQMDFFWAAQSFLPNGTNYQLTSIDAIVGNGANSPEVLVELRGADINGQIDQTPAGLLTTLSSPDMSGRTGVRTFFPDSTVSLLATEHYWFVLGTTNAGTFDWSYADSNNFDGPGLLGSFADTSDAGMTWNYGIKSPYFLAVNAMATDLLGDVNCDGFVNLLDVSPFVDLITSGGFSLKADINQDGAVNLLDVAPFVDLLTGG